MMKNIKKISALCLVSFLMGAGFTYASFSTSLVQNGSDEAAILVARGGDGTGPRGEVPRKGGDGTGPRGEAPAGGDGVGPRK